MATFGVSASQLDGNVATTNKVNMVEMIKAMAPQPVVEQKTFTTTKVDNMINALKETHQLEMEKLKDVHQLEMQRLKDAHQVEVTLLKNEISKQAGEISVLTEQNKKLTDEVKVLKDQVAELQLQVQTILTQLDDLRQKSVQAGPK